MMRRLSILVFSLLLILIACTSQDNPNGDDLIGLNSGPTPLMDQDGGLQAASTFLDAWAAQDYNTMYGLISPNARDAYPQSEFTSVYENIWSDLNLQSLSWERGNTASQGTTVLFNYTVHFISPTLGEFTDTERLMRIIPTPEGMRVAWSRMDIFEGWSSGARLDVRSILPTRGNIYDRNGNALADQNGQAVEIYLTRNRISDEEGCIQELILMLGREYDDLRASFDQNNPDTIFFVGDIDPETYNSNRQLIDAKCRPSSTPTRLTRRYFGAAAPHVVGYIGRIPAEQAQEYAAIGYPVDAMVGLAGIERSWEDELRGKIGNNLTLYSATDEPIKVIAQNEATPGQSVYLTIDRELQREIQVAFAEAYTLSAATWSDDSPGAAGVIMDVQTGAVLAMVSYPGFDPAVFNPDNKYLDPGGLITQYSQQQSLLNRATQGQYPLGSVFKLVSSTAGADSGIVPLDTVYPCSAEWFGGQYGDSREKRTNWNPVNEGSIDGQMAIMRSCNPYYWQMGVQLENADPFLLPNYARNMGLGVLTGIRGVEEAGGRIPDPDYKSSQGFTWSVADTLNIVIGQGEIAVNPLQVARMVATIANDGKLLTPYLVEEVKLIGQDPLYTHEVEFEQLDLDPIVLAGVREAMCNVTTNPVGTAHFIFGDWYEWQANPVTICGKTGTAQSSADRPPHAWFAAFTPADEPEIAIVVIVENSCEGSEVAAPMVRRMVEIYYGMPQSVWPPLWQSGCSEIVVE